MAQNSTRKNQVIHIYIPNADAERLKVAAEDENRSRSKMAALLIAEALNARQAAQPDLTVPDRSNLQPTSQPNGYHHR